MGELLRLLPRLFLTRSCVGSLKVKYLGLDAARASATDALGKRVRDIKFEPKGSTSLNEPKYGKEDPRNEEHHGGNTWAGGVRHLFQYTLVSSSSSHRALSQTGGRDTAGLGGRGGYMRLFKGHDIKQVSDELKAAVPDSVKEKAREMARAELERRLKELDMREGEAKEYGMLLGEVGVHIAALHDLLESESSFAEERLRAGLIFA